MLVLVLQWVEYSELQFCFVFFFIKKKILRDGGDRRGEKMVGARVNLIPDDLKEVRIISYSPGWADHYQSQVCWLHGKDLWLSK